MGTCIVFGVWIMTMMMLLSEAVNDSCSINVVMTNSTLQIGKITYKNIIIIVVECTANRIEVWLKDMIAMIGRTQEFVEHAFRPSWSFDEDFGNPVIMVWAIIIEPCNITTIIAKKITVDGACLMRNVATICKRLRPRLETTCLHKTRMFI